MNTKLCNSILEISKTLNVKPLKMVSHLIKLNNENSNEFKDLMDISIYIINNDNLLPSSIPSSLMDKLCEFKLNDLKLYYNSLDDKNKFKLVKKLRYPERLVGIKFNRGLNFKCIEWFFGNFNNTDEKYISMYNLINNNFDYIFKFLNFNKNRRFETSLEIAFEGENICNKYFIKILIKRISYYNENKISNKTISTILKVINNLPNDNLDKIKVKEALEKHVPEKILVNLSI